MEGTLTNDCHFLADRAAPYDHLIDYAEADSTVSYGTLASYMDMKASTPCFLRLLRSTQKEEHYSGRPLVTAV